MTDTMDIEVNGKTRRVPAGCTVDALLEELDLDRRMVVVELNRQILRATELAQMPLHPGDRLELVHFVGGG